jgi:hypothetical protein
MTKTRILLLIAALVMALPMAAQTNQQEAAAAAYAVDALQLTPASPSASLAIAVDTTQLFSVSVLAPSRTLTVSLVAPNSQRFTVGDPETATFENGTFPIDSTTTTPGASYLASVRNPFTGTWRLEVSETATLTAPLDIIVTTLLNNSTRLVLLGGGDTYPAGQDIRLALAAFDGMTRMTSLNISAQVRPAGAGTPMPVNFRDDGAGADTVAGDGIYEAFVNPGAGTFIARADVSGTASTGQFRRSAASQFRVVPRNAQISGFTDRGIDDNFDTLYDRVGVRASANVLVAGNYVVSVRLRASNGRELLRSVAQALGVGTASPEVFFSGNDITSELGVDGPYTVAEIRYMQSAGGDLVPADIRYDLGSTAAYRLSQLQHPRLRLSGIGTATGIDLNGNGQYDQLRIDLGVIADFAGSYSFSGSLTDADGFELGFRSGSVFFPSAGTYNLAMTFAGRPIGEHGVDGPYFLSNFIMFGAGQSLIATTAFTTQAFRASQFEGFILDNTPPTVSVSVTPNVLWPVDHKLYEIVATVTATDDRDPEPDIQLASVTSNEGDNVHGDGNTSPDIVIDNGRIYLRAERSALGKDGRVYTITFSARDDAGNFGTGSATVTVPHSQGGN